MKPYFSPASCVCCPQLSRLVNVPLIRARTPFSSSVSTTTSARPSSSSTSETTVPLTVELPASLAAFIADKSKKTGLSVGDIIAEAVEQSRSNGDSMDSVYIMEPIVTLVDGLLHGEHTVNQALAKGNLGLGTLDMLDGEVVVYEGIAYQQDAEGKTNLLSGTEMSPFMTMAWFFKDHSRTIKLDKPMDLKQLYEFLKGTMRSGNVFHAITIEGNFPHIKTRAVRKQAEGRRLIDVAATQAIFDLNNEKGLLVGFWTPEFMGSAISVPGFHLHFLSDDRQRGGHLLNCTVEAGAVVTIQEIHRTKVDLPYRADFMGASFEDPTKDIEAAEKE